MLVLRTSTPYIGAGPRTWSSGRLGQKTGHSGSTLPPPTHKNTSSSGKVKDKNPRLSFHLQSTEDEKSNLWGWRAELSNHELVLKRSSQSHPRKSKKNEDSCASLKKGQSEHSRVSKLETSAAHHTGRKCPEDTPDPPTDTRTPDTYAEHR